MRIEILFSEVANLYGELANISYIKNSCPECEIIETSLKETPKFLAADSGIDLVYMGTMAESAQLLVLDKFRPVKDQLTAAIERGQHFLITGNALELFGDKITDVDGTETACLGIFNFHTIKDMMNRYNSLYIGKYGDLDVVGFKSQFTHSYYDSEIPPLFRTTRGPGFNPDIKNEGIHYKNFMATYIIGPLFVLNPLLMVRVLDEMGFPDVHPAHEEAAVDAYRVRLAEYSEPNRGFIY